MGGVPRPVRLLGGSNPFADSGVQGVNHTFRHNSNGAAEVKPCRQRVSVVGALPAIRDAARGSLLGVYARHERYVEL